MAMAALLILQTLVTALAAAFFWRRHDNLRAEVTDLRAALDALQANTALARHTRKRAEPGAIAELHVAGAMAPDAPLDRARMRWRLPAAPANSNTPRLEALHGAVLALAGAAPAFGLFFGVSAGIVVSSGLFIAAALLLSGLSPRWTLAAPASLAFALVWSGLALALGLRDILIAAPLAALGVTALACQRIRSDWFGAAIAGVAAITALALGWQTSFISAPGLAFATVVAGAAIAGASSLRLDALLIGAFALSLLGLFAVSGQDSAAIWFTPIVALHAALFLAIAIVRVPQLGGRGALVAGLAALSVLGAAVALNLSQHGLANNFAAAGVFAFAAVAFAGVIALAASRRERGLVALKLTLWILALACLAALGFAIALAAQPLIAAPAAALVALGAVLLDTRHRANAWRACALGALGVALAHAYGSAHQLLSESPHWPPLALIAFGVALPAAISAATAHFAHRTKAAFTASAAEATALVLGVAGASIALRAASAGGAFLLTPITFVEAGLHCAIWLAVALACAARSHRGAAALRFVFAHLLGASALAAMCAASLLWMTSHWTQRAPEGAGLLSYAPLGFLLPAFAAGAHWLFWRARNRDLQVRIAFGAGVFMLAGFATLATLGVAALSETTRALICALVIATAVALNFVPGVAEAAARPTARRRRRRQLPQQA